MEGFCFAQFEALHVIWSIHFFCLLNFTAINIKWRKCSKYYYLISHPNEGQQSYHVPQSTSSQRKLYQNRKHTFFILIYRKCGKFVSILFGAFRIWICFHGVFAILLYFNMIYKANKANKYISSIQKVMIDIYLEGV